MRYNLLRRVSVIGHWSLVILLQTGWAWAFPLSITSNPPGAQVSIDGQVQGATPLTVEIPSDHLQCQLSLALAGYQSVQMGFAAAPIPFLRLHFDLQPEERPASTVQGPAALSGVDVGRGTWDVGVEPRILGSETPPGDEALRTWVHSLLLAIGLIGPG